MKTCVYTLTWNNELVLPHFLNHYSFADRIVVYDDGSDDTTQGVFEQLELRPGQERVWRKYDDLSGGKFREDVRAELKSTCWHECKEQEYDWVIIVDPDEFIYHPSGLELFLERAKEAEQSFIPATGYEMIWHEYPTSVAPLTDYIRRGVRNDLYSKTSVFSPKFMRSIRYTVGCHFAYMEVIGGKDPIEPTGIDPKPLKPWPVFIRQVSRTPAHPLMLLHYRFMGPAHVGKLWETYKPRMSDENKKNGWDRHCYLPKTEQERVYKLLQEEAEILF